MLRAHGGIERPLLIAGVAGDSFLSAVTAKHAERHDGEDEEQQQCGNERHAALTVGRGLMPRHHELTPAAFMTAMTRVMVIGLAGLIGFVNVTFKLIEQTALQSAVNIWLAFK